jgi:hypothetical protein
MPNHTYNTLTIEPKSIVDAEQNIKEILNTIKSDDGEPIDFNKIIPMPECLKNVTSTTLFTTEIDKIEEKIREKNEQFNWGFTEEQIQDRIKRDTEIAELYNENIAKTGYKCWYDWSCDNWGTKWNAYQQELDEKTNQIHFQTAWASPEPVIKKLSEMFPNATFLVTYQDEFEDEEHEYEYENGKCTLNAY